MLYKNVLKWRSCILWLLPLHLFSYWKPFSGRNQATIQVFKVAPPRLVRASIMFQRRIFVSAPRMLKQWLEEGFKQSKTNMTIDKIPKFTSIRKWGGWIQLKWSPWPCQLSWSWPCNLSWSWPCRGLDLVMVLTLSWSLRPCQSALAQCEDNDMGPRCAWLIGICINMYQQYNPAY